MQLPIRFFSNPVPIANLSCIDTNSDRPVTVLNTYLKGGVGGWNRSLKPKMSKFSNGRVIKCTELFCLEKVEQIFFVFHLVFLPLFYRQPSITGGMKQLFFVTNCNAILWVQFHRCNVAEIILFSHRCCEDASCLFVALSDL